jgi:DNA-binding transcriptional ArsR family regulator
MRAPDPQAIRALAHPLRLNLLELLGATGPATAAQCGRVLGVPQANCSFHLRQLAKYGYVEESPPGPDRRERQWRVATPAPELRVDGGAAAGRELERLVVERETAAIRAYADRGAGESGLGMVAAVASVTPQEAAELRARWKELLEPYLGRADADRPGARHVRFFMAATPFVAGTEGEIS